MSTASAASQAGNVVVKVSGTTTSRITTPAVTANATHVTTTAGKTTTSKQVGTPAVTVYIAEDGSKHTISKPATASLAERTAATKNLPAPEAQENSFMDGVHTALDVAGLIPGAGTLEDLANGIICAAEGDWSNALISTAAIFVDVVSGVKLATKTSKEVIGEGFETVAEKAVKNGVEELGEEAAEKAGKETAENVAEKTGKKVIEGGSEVIKKLDDLLSNKTLTYVK